MDAAVVNNAANVRLNLGHMDSALALYRQSVELEPNPVVLFNLSQAHGRAFQVEELSRVLAEAQQLDGDLVAELTALQGAEPVGFVVDLPLDTSQIWKRILRTDTGERIASELRATLAPGLLGKKWLLTLGVSCAIGILFAGVGRKVARSSWCDRCGRRICSHCDPEQMGQICSSCTRLFRQSDTTDQELRRARIKELRERQGRMETLATTASFLVPGAAGILAGRPLRALFGSLLAATALLSILWRGGVVPDPLVAGPSVSLAFLSIALVATIAYVLTALLCLATRRNA